ncbi:MAG: hypothetical protein HZB38_13670 [Planctomycetes bacterium]|nr:hypothetical protein [Planctomycetota bacterium]
MMDNARLIAPSQHLGVLVEPRRLDPNSITHFKNSRILDVTLGDVRGDLLSHFRLDRKRVVATGHQAEFFHAGVFAKTIATDLLAARFDATGVFVLVDSDLAKAGTLAVPVLREESASLMQLPLPRVRHDLTVEDQPTAEPAEWAKLFDAATRGMGDGTQRLLSSFASGLRANPTMNLADVVSSGQAAVERELGLRPARVLRISQLCGTRAFRAFVANWTLHADRFAARYNEALPHYRRRHRIRTPQRPAPPLYIGAPTECPFWISRAGSPRSRLFVQVQRDRVLFFAERERVWETSLVHLSRFANHETPWELERSGWRVRPRALTLSAFLRGFLADVFIHGIGGAHYDEATDAFMRDGLEISLPPRACVTATVRLDAAMQPVEQSALPPSRREVRYNPQRALRSTPPELRDLRARLIADSIRLRTEQRLDRAARRANWEAIRATNAAIARAAPDELRLIEAEWRRQARLASEWPIRTSREYFFGLHSRITMLALADRLRAALESEPSAATASLG